MRTKKVPMRLCLGCRESKPKRELVRIVRSPEGEFSVDSTGKSPGRGAYICPREECFQKALKTKALERTFQTKIDPHLYEKLEGALMETQHES